MTVVIAPSLTALARPRPGPATGDLVAVDIADFSAYPNVPSLDLIATSAKAAYRRWHRHGRLRAALSDADATVDAVLDRADDLAKAGFIQLVTHGTNPRPEAAVEPRLALYDGALDDLDLALWSLDGPLVLLLACHSGQRAVRGETGAELVADEVNGLAAALFSAGAGAVLGALWHAEEPFAAALIAPLHDRLLAGEPADHALREALRNTRDSRPLFRRPYFWAPYTLTTATLLPTKDQP
jgi:CHAT domain-containing protein